MQRRNVDPTSLIEIGARLKLARLALGKTQAEMASAMGSSTEGQAWENYAAGRRRIKTENALALRWLGLPIEWIFEGHEGRMAGDLLAAIKALRKQQNGGGQSPTSRKSRAGR